MNLSQFSYDNNLQLMVCDRNVSIAYANNIVYHFSCPPFVTSNTWVNLGSRIHSFILLLLLRMLPFSSRSYINVHCMTCAVHRTNQIVYSALFSFYENSKRQHCHRKSLGANEVTKQCDSKMLHGKTFHVIVVIIT